MHRAAFSLVLVLVAGCSSSGEAVEPPTETSVAADAGDAATDVVAADAPADDALDGGVADSVADGAAAGWWSPAPGASWQWQLSGALDTTFDVEVYDIDLFGTTAAQIDALHAAKRKVVCYFDTAYEPDRPDSTKLAPYKGNAVVGWPGQYWLDIRQAAVVSVMNDRIALAQTKRCDAVEADDVDARSNDPGFPLTAADQQGFIRGLAKEAHARGLGFALKNDLEEIPVLLPDVDFAVNEECFQYDECELLKPFVAAGKAVFHVEYTDGDLAAKGATVCPTANALNFDSLIKRPDLDPPRFACR